MANRIWLDARSLCFAVRIFGNILLQVGSASIRGARFALSLVGIGRSDEQSLSTNMVREAWALRAVSCACTALLVCPIRRWWVPGLPGVGHAGGAMRERYLQLYCS